MLLPWDRCKRVIDGKNDCVPLQTQPLKEKIYFNVIISRKDKI